MSDHNDRIPQQPSPYEELVKDWPNASALLKFLKILDFKAQAAFDRTVSNQKVLSSFDDEFFLNIQENEEIREVLRKNFFNRPNVTNPIECSREYQSEQGLTQKAPPLDDPDYDIAIDVDFGEDGLNRAFDSALKLLQRINPDIGSYDLYEFIEMT